MKAAMLPHFARSALRLRSGVVKHAWTACVVRPGPGIVQLASRHTPRALCTAAKTPFVFRYVHGQLFARLRLVSFMCMVSSFAAAWCLRAVPAVGKPQPLTCWRSGSRPSASECFASRRLRRFAFKVWTGIVLVEYNVVAGLM